MVEGEDCQACCSFNGVAAAEAFLGAHAPEDIIEAFVGVLCRTHKTAFKETPLGQLQVRGFDYLKNSLWDGVVVHIGLSSTSNDLLKLETPAAGRMAACLQETMC